MFYRFPSNTAFSQALLQTEANNIPTYGICILQNPNNLTKGCFSCLVSKVGNTAVYFWLPMEYHGCLLPRLFPTVISPFK